MMRVVDSRKESNRECWKGMFQRYRKAEGIQVVKFKRKRESYRFFGLVHVGWWCGTSGMIPDINFVSFSVWPIRHVHFMWRFISSWCRLYSCVIYPYYSFNYGPNSFPWYAHCVCNHGFCISYYSAQVKIELVVHLRFFSPEQ